MFRKIIQPFYTGYAVITFLACFCIILPFLFLISLSNSIGARKALYFIVKVSVEIWLFIVGMSAKKNGTLPPKGRYIIIANHISYLDTIMLFPALPSYFRPLGKKEFSRIPVFGYLYKQLVIMVDRGNAASRVKSMRIMWHILKHEADIVLFPEGTFNETGAPLKEFYNGAFQLAINTQTPILPIILPDTLKRWHYSAWWKLWPGENRVIYMDPVEVTGMTKNQLPHLKNTLYELMQSELLKYGKL